MNQLKTLLFLVLIIAVSSCAQMVNGEYKTIKFESNKPMKTIIMAQDTFYPDAKSCKIKVIRERAIKYTQVVFDTAEISFQIKSYVSNTYALGNMMTPLFVGYMFDASSDRAYTYPSRFYFDVQNHEVSILKWKPVEKGQKRWVISSNNINVLNVNLGGQDSLYTTAWGLSVGLEKFYHKNKFLSMGLNWTSDHIFPIANGWKKDSDESVSAFSLYCRNNGMRDDIEYGYGCQLTHFRWLGMGNFDTRRDNSWALGGSFMAQYRLTEHFRLGIFYNPNLLQLHDSHIRLKYQPQFSFEGVWKF